MRNTHAPVLLMLVLLVVTPATAQMPAAAGPGEMPVDPELDQVLAEMGVDPEARMMFQMLDQGGGMNPMLMMMMLRGMGGGMDEEMAFLMMMQNAQGQGAQAPPDLLVAGDTVVIIEDGVVYKIGLADLEVRGQVEYQPQERPSMARMLLDILPVLAGGPGGGAGGPEGAMQNAQLNTCQSNLKQLGLATMQYLADNQGQYPGDNWATVVQPDLGDLGILRCPGAAEHEVGYAINEALIGLGEADLTEPGLTVLLIEADPGAGPMAGGPERLVARHGGNAVVCFCDGHVEIMPLDQALQNLIWNPLEQ